MTDLVEFLRAREAERGQGARALSGTTLDAYLEGGDDGWAVEGEKGIGAIIGDRALAEHIARHDPAWALREVAAMRRVIDLHGRGEEPSDHLCRECANPYPCETVRLLALPDAGHPDYRAEEWAP